MIGGRTRRIVAVALTGAALQPWATCGAAPWLLRPTFAAQAQYQSNPQLDTRAARAGSGELVSIGLPLVWADGRTAFELAPQANFGRSRGAAGLGVDDRSVDLRWSRGVARGEYTFDAGHSRTDLFGPDAEDLGTLRPDGHQTIDRAALGRRIATSERGQLTLGADWRRHRYDTPSDPTLFDDYSYASASLDYAYALHPRLTWLLSGGYGRYRARATDRTADNWSAQTGARVLLRDNLELTGTFGPSAASSNGAARDSQGSASTLALGWSHPTWRLDLASRRSSEPGGFGEITQQRSTTLGLSHDWSERTSVGASLRALRSRTEFSRFALAERRYRAAELWARHRLTAEWRVDLRASWSEAKYPATALRVAAPDAASRGGSIAFTREFGPTRLNWF